MKLSMRRMKTPRSARYFELGDRSASEMWLLLHGYGQLARDFIDEFAAISDGRLLVAAEGLSRFYTRQGRIVGASWMTAEDREAEIDDYVEYLSRVVADARFETANVTVLGFSQGGHTACRWAASQNRVGHLVVWGSTLPIDLDEAGFRRSLIEGRVTLVAGRDDRHVSEEQLAADLQRLRSWKMSAEVIRFEGGHEIEAETLASLADQSPG